MIDFGFAFNQRNYSDRILRVEILSSDDSSPPDESDCVPIRNRKRKREDLDNANGDEVVDSFDSASSTVDKVTTLHISSAILAANSPFFYKLFTNGMRESHLRHLTSLRIDAYEEASLMDLLNFIYGKTLSATTAPELLDVLMIADKFGVTSCMKYCSELIATMPMSTESALLYLELPSSVLMAKEYKPLKYAARECLTPFCELQEEAMALPLSTLELLLHSNYLEVNSEDDVLDFIIKWGHEHYPKPEEYKEIFNKHLKQFIRFPYLSCWRLQEVLVKPDFDDNEQVSRLVQEALFFRAGLPYAKVDVPVRLVTNDLCFKERLYQHRAIKVVGFPFPDWPCCVVYLDLEKYDCADLFPSKWLSSPPIHLGGRCFFLKAECNMDQRTSTYHLSLYVDICDCVGDENFTLDYEIEVKMKSSQDFQSKYKLNNCRFANTKYVGERNLFGIQWNDFMCDESDYFIDSILHLRAELTIKNSAA